MSGASRDRRWNIGGVIKPTPSAKVVDHAFTVGLPVKLVLKAPEHVISSASSSKNSSHQSLKSTGGQGSTVSSDTQSTGEKEYPVGKISLVHPYIKVYQFLEKGHKEARGFQDKEMTLPGAAYGEDELIPLKVDEQQKYNLYK